MQSGSGSGFVGVINVCLQAKKSRSLRLDIAENTRLQTIGFVVDLSQTTDEIRPRTFPRGLLYRKSSKEISEDPKKVVGYWLLL